MSSTSAVTQQIAVPVQQPVSSFNENYAISMGHNPLVIGEIVGAGHMIFGAGKFTVNLFDFAITGIGSVVTPKNIRGKCKARLPECRAGLSGAVDMIGRGVIEIIPGGGLYLKERDKRCELEKKMCGLLKNFEKIDNELNASQKIVEEAQIQLEIQKDKLSQLEAQNHEGESDKQKIDLQKKEIDLQKKEITNLEDTLRKVTLERDSLKKQIPASKGKR